MKSAKILIVGGGIGGLTAAIALRRQGFDVEIIEKDPSWKVYGVGIIQQSNVVRAMDALGLLDHYLSAAFGFDFVEVYLPNGTRVARIPSPKLIEGRPANLGIARPALHKVLGDRAIVAGARVRLGVTALQIRDAGTSVEVQFSDGTQGTYDLVIGADGVHSETRRMVAPAAPAPEFTGQSVWRYNLPRPAELDCLRAYEGPMGVGLVPLSESLMYMFVTTPEPGNVRYERNGLAASMRAKLSAAPPEIAALVPQITDDAAVVYKPEECIFLEGDWHRGRIVLVGDAVHATTPHLGQGAGMAIEDGIVLAEELARHDTPEQAFRAYRERRFTRCEFTVRLSRSICDSQLGKRERVDQAKATMEMFKVMAQPL